MASLRDSSAPVALNSNAVIPFVTHASTLTPAAPDATPTYIIQDAAGLGDGTTLATGSATAVSGETADFFINHPMTEATFAAGETYYCVRIWLVNAVEYREYTDIPVV